jgi:hypothetical protein
MNHQAIEALYNQRLKDIEKVINIQSCDDPDLRQEARWGAYLALQKDRTAKDRFLLNKAKWQMVSSLRKGKSADTGYYKRKDLKVIHYDHLPLADGVFAEAVSSNGKDPVDEQAIFRVDLERFFDRLSTNETLYVRYKTMDGLPDVRIRERLRVTFPLLYEMKRNIRRQIGLAFAG